MPSLNRNILSAKRLEVDVAMPSQHPPVGILQIGDGNFLRGFVDWMVDVANGAGLMNGHVTVAAPLGHGIVDRLNAQEGLFTVLLRGVQGGKVFESRRLITCVKAGINPSHDWSAMTACAEDLALRFVVSNTTEAGIAYTEEPFINGRCPASFPAKVAALLYHRFTVLGPSPKTGLIFLPCELIEANGDNLRRIVLIHARAWDLPQAFIDWVERDNYFLNTLVDRIVPGFPASESAGIFADLGYDDPLLVAAEPFHLWVIEGPQEIAHELPLSRAGLDVVWTNDLQPYRTRKVRILNGAHTASALAAYSAGLDTVQSMIDDEVVSQYLNKLMFDEIVPFVPLPEDERQSYARTIMERFANPYIRHELISIALNSVSKWQVRVLPTVRDYVREHGKAPARLSFSLAALLHFYHGTLNADGIYNGHRNGQSYVIKDNPEVLTVFAEAWRAWQPGQDVSGLVRGLLGDARLWGEDLNLVPGLAEQVSASLARIKAHGVKAAMQAL